MNTLDTPPPPEISSGGQPQQNALARPQPAQSMPAPSHGHTVAALRHFHSIVAELKTLLANPDLGKSDLKSEIIDGASKLVAARIITPANAVQQLSSVPENPRQQRQWVMQSLQQTIAASNNVLDHHAAGHHGSLDWATESQHPEFGEDNHFQAMEGLTAQYRPGA